MSTGRCEAGAESQHLEGSRLGPWNRGKSLEMVFGCPLVVTDMQIAVLDYRTVCVCHVLSQCRSLSWEC